MYNETVKEYKVVKKFSDISQKSIYFVKKQIKESIIEIGKRCYAKGFVASNDGNISVRLDSSSFYITASGKSKGFLIEEDILLCDLEGKLLEGSGKISSEVKMHSMVYKNRADVNGICHAHPIYSTTFAVAGVPFDQPILAEVVVSLGKIPLVEYATPGTDQLPKNIKRYVDSYDGFLLEKHGVLTLGKDLEMAYYR
ncbi:MAG: hypothetical protein B6226_04995, partial [Candidatus Cloacimonetes bacterium 4572_65]